MTLFDTKNKIFKKLKNQNEINIYLCGPTVYDDAHLGHARSAVCFDLLYRVLVALGYKVNFARNYTDIDDKILAKIKELNTNLKDFTNHFILNYEKDMKVLNIIDPDFKPKATEYIQEMITFIKILEKKGFTYTLDDGIYFDSEKNTHHTPWTNRDLNNSESRLNNDTKKKSEADFVLWKFDDNFYEASFGNGRPGWHTECVVMINSIFKNNLDIHCGGIDLLFPHHENEDIQCNCAFDKNLANIWLHNGFVKIDGEKMSKSLNNSFFIKDALKYFHGEVLRFYLLQIHYRSHFNYSLDDLKSCKKRLDKFYRLKNRLGLDYFNDIKDYNLNFKSEIAQDILHILSDDLNISKALAKLDEFIINANLALDKNIDKDIKSKLHQIFIECALIFGIGFETKYFQFGIDDEFKKEIEKQITIRNEAKKNKNFKLADEIRNNLASKHIILQDTQNGTTWETI